MSRAEVHLLAATSGVHQLVFRLLYGTGMRKMECLRLRVKDVDFDRRVIVIREGKGNKDRVTMLPGALEAACVGNSTTPGREDGPRGPAPRGGHSAFARRRAGRGL